jgi:hypothetical protein
VQAPSLPIRSPSSCPARSQSGHVDCEYNRNHDEPKRLELPVEPSRSDDTNAKSVFPDIIVHHRNTQDNLLVIEVKKSTNPDGGDFDKAKLRAFLGAPYAYRQGLFIIFTTGTQDLSNYYLEWFPSPE